MTNLKRFLLTLLAVSTLTVAVGQTRDDYKTSKEYTALRDSMHKAFNNADSAKFYPAIKRLENYLLQQDDLHAYYTQRCNEIVFQLNRQNIFEAYKLAKNLSMELTERKLDSEMYMAINMMGHIYNYTGNKETAKECFWEVIHRMEKEGYTESQTPIYMNLVNILMDENPEEALRLIDKALSIAREISPAREFDIETRRTLAYYQLGDMPKFLEGYKRYKEGTDSGLTSVHGRSLEIYYLTSQGKTDEAVRLAKQSVNDPFETMAEIYAKAGRWEEAYEALGKGTAESDSINSIILSSSMQGIQEELQVYEAERQAQRTKFYAISAIALLLLLLVLALAYIVRSRRSHLEEMQKAYDRILESDRMKTAFVQNVSHEVRTPLNIISGFAQIIADPEYEINQEERKHIAEAVKHNTHLITTMIDEVLEISDSEMTEKPQLSPIHCNNLTRQVISDFCYEIGKEEDIFRFQTALSDDFTINGQEKTIKRVIAPLLDNAVKNNPDDKQIDVKAAAEGGHLTVTIQDYGPGIPASEAEHIFERFVKLNNFKEGLGLGLTFSRTMARRLGGDVTLDTSYAGPGARFKVII